MMKRMLLICAMVIGVLSFAGVASAHHPVLTGTVARPCGAEAQWTGTFTARSDSDFNKDWRSKHKIGSGSYTSFGPWVDDQVNYGPIAVGPFSASTASVIITVSSEWGRKSDHSKDQASATGIVTLVRPATTECPPPPTTTIPPTTTQPPETTLPPTTLPPETTVPPTTVPPTDPPVTTQPPTTTVPPVVTTVPPVVTTVPPTVSVVDPPVPTTAAPALVQEVELPRTGAAETLAMIAMAIAFIGLGAVAVALARRKANA